MQHECYVVGVLLLGAFRQGKCLDQDEGLWPDNPSTDNVIYATWHFSFDADLLARFKRQVNAAKGIQLQFINLNRGYFLVVYLLAADSINFNRLSGSGNNAVEASRGDCMGVVVLLQTPQDGRIRI